MKVLKFGAIWCPGCLIMKPRWAEIEKENPWLETIYYDYDQNKKEVEQWNIGQLLPVFIFVDDNNNEILRLTGEHSKKELLEIIEKKRRRD